MRFHAILVNQQYTNPRPPRRPAGCSGLVPPTDRAARSGERYRAELRRQVVPATLQHVQWRELLLGQDDALKRVLGSDRIPHATRPANDQQDKQRQGLAELRDTTAAIAFRCCPESGAR